MPMHDDEIVLADETARTLITDQFPQWAGEPIRRINVSGTVNAIFRIGERYAARFPLRGRDPGHTRRLLEAEASASAEFARASPFPAPEPIALHPPTEPIALHPPTEPVALHTPPEPVGLHPPTEPVALHTPPELVEGPRRGRHFESPGDGYPLPWSVQTWISGADAATDDPGRSDAFARDLARLIGALRGVDLRGRTFTGDNRGGLLSDHDTWVQKCLDRSGRLLDVARLTKLWSYFRELPRTDPDVMTHGDLIPANVLVADGRLTGVLDTGGFGAADPALDVIAGWHLLDDGPREVFRAELNSDDPQWERSKAWAFEQAIGLVWYYTDTNPAMSRMGRKTLARIIAAAPL